MKFTEYSIDSWSDGMGWHDNDAWKFQSLEVPDDSTDEQILAKFGFHALTPVEEVDLHETDYQLCYQRIGDDIEIVEFNPHWWIDALAEMGTNYDDATKSQIEECEEEHGWAAFVPAARIVWEEDV